MTGQPPSKPDVPPESGLDPTPPRGPLQGLEDLSELLDDERFDRALFLRGLTIGALVGCRTGRPVDLAPPQPGAAEAAQAADRVDVSGITALML